MCVIVYKPKGYALPDKKDLKACFEHNPDGAGYMLPLQGKVFIRKGFMDFKAFYKSLNGVAKKNSLDLTDVPLVMHFRITTQGGVQRALCHPFAVCRDYETMRLEAYFAEMGLAHNGIISLTSESDYSYGYWDSKTKSYVRGAPRKLDHNDTMKFIKDYASLIIDGDMDFGKNHAKCELLERLSGSKLAIMTKKGDVTLIGDFCEVGGIMYSNLNHVDTRGTAGGCFKTMSSSEFMAKYGQYMDDDDAEEYMDLYSYSHR